MPTTEKYNLLRASSGLRSYVIRVGILRKSKSYFAKKYGISSNSIKKYEESASIRSKETSENLYKAYLEEGLMIPSDWFFLGEGYYEVSEEVFYKLFYTIYDIDSHTYIDSILFLSRYADSEIHLIENQDNEPSYSRGDYVGFVWRKMRSILVMVKVFCAVEIAGVIVFGFCTKVSRNKIRLEIKRTSRIILVERIGPVIYHRISKNYTEISLENMVDLEEEG